MRLNKLSTWYLLEMCKTWRKIAKNKKRGGIFGTDEECLRALRHYQTQLVKRRKERERRLF